MRINGCEIGSYSRLSNKCRKCMYKDYCKNKSKKAPELSSYKAIEVAKEYGVTVDEYAAALYKLSAAVQSEMKV